MPREHYFLLGAVLFFVVELAAPGFGIFGVGSILCLTAGIFFLLGGGLKALAILAGIYFLLALVLIFCCFYLPREHKWNPFVLWDKQRNSDGYTGSRDFSALVGKRGITLTPLRPAGTISLDGERLDVTSLGDYILKGEKVLIVKVEGSKLFVKKA